MGSRKVYQCGAGPLDVRLALDDIELGVGASGAVGLDGKCAARRFGKTCNHWPRISHVGDESGVGSHGGLSHSARPAGAPFAFLPVGPRRTIGPADRAPARVPQPALDAGSGQDPPVADPNGCREPPEQANRR